MRYPFFSASPKAAWLPVSGTMTPIRMVFWQTPLIEAAIQRATNAANLKKRIVCLACAYETDCQIAALYLLPQWLKAFFRDVYFFFNLALKGTIQPRRRCCIPLAQEARGLNADG